MIRLVLTRNEDGDPATWIDVHRVEHGQVTLADCYRFDAELEAAPELGVSCWAEALWRMDDLAKRLSGHLHELGDGADDETVGLWLASQPAHRLAEIVTVWAALGAAGSPRTLRQLLDTPGRDIEALPEAERGKGAGLIRLRTARSALLATLRRLVWR